MIRKAEKSDIPVLAKLASLPGVWGGPEEELYEDFRELLDSEKDLVAVFEQNGEVIGFANIRLRSEYVAGTKSSPVAYLEGIAVFEEYRKKGIAREFLDFIEKEFGPDRIRLEVEEDNENAISLYKKKGYRFLPYLQMVKDKAEA